MDFQVHKSGSFLGVNLGKTFCALQSCNALQGKGCAFYPSYRFIFTDAPLSTYTLFFSFSAHYYWCWDCNSSWLDLEVPSIARGDRATTFDQELFGS